MMLLKKERDESKHTVACWLKSATHDLDKPAVSSVKVVSNILPGEFQGLLCLQTSPVVQFGWVFPRSMWVNLLVFNKWIIKRKL
jgi:hypothetical protein